MELIFFKIWANIMSIISLLILLDYDCAKLSFDMVLYGCRENTTDIYAKILGRIKKWK